MCKVVDLQKWKARRRREEPRRAPTSRATHDRPGLVSIGVISSELVRRLMEE
jgi:hypothetical protein